MTYISKNVPPSLVIQPEWEEVSSYSEGKVVVRTNAKEGYVNELGEWVLKPAYDYCSPFRFGFACIKVAGRWGAIDSKGNLLGGRYFDEVTSFKNGKCWVRSKGKAGYLDERGTLTWVRSIIHLPVGYLSDNYASLNAEWIQSL